MIIAGSNGSRTDTGTSAVTPLTPGGRPAIDDESPHVDGASLRIVHQPSGGNTEHSVAQLLLARERRRMATDVHDLVMQDLALALANAHALGDQPNDRARISLVVGALERALAGARDVLGGLAELDTRPIAQAVEASARLAARHTPLAFRTARLPPVAASPDRQTREALVHIAREAVTNAVKHARPSEIEVVLEHADGWRLTVRDDGCGFDKLPARPAVGGFGVASMHASAHALGGTMQIGSAAGKGTTVEAVLP